MSRSFLLAHQFPARYHPPRTPSPPNHHARVCTMSTRRAFLQASAAAGLAAFNVSANYAKDANDTIQVGLIGCGGRCHHLVQSLVKIPKVHIAAVCDVWDVNLAKAQKWGDGKQGATKDYKALLDLKEIDAVLIASPDHWHVPMTVDACAAGKDVYVEKPLTHNLAEGKAVIDAQNKHQRIVQVGMQQRSMPQFQKACEIVRSGGIGKVYKVHLTWNRNADVSGVRRGQVDPKQVNWKDFLGNAPQQSFDEYRFRNWRWFWDFGNGVLTDLMVHYIDVVHWYFNVDHPLKATTIGNQFQTKG